MLRFFAVTLILFMALSTAKSHDLEPIDVDDVSRQWAEIAHGKEHLKTWQFRDARNNFHSALKGLEKIYGKDSPEIGPAIVYLSIANAALGNKRQQNKLYNRALELIAKHHGESSTQYADIKLSAGLSLFEYAGDVVGGRTQVKEAYDIYGELTESVHAGQASAILSLGHMYLMGGQIEKAQQYLSRAKDIYTKLPNLADSRLGLAALSLGKTLLSSTQFGLAQHYFLVALEGLSTAHPELVSDHVDARAGLVSAYVLDGKPELASEHCVAVREWTYRSIPDSQKITRVAPIYPPSLSASGAEGYVDMSFTVDEKGFVRSPRVISVEGHRDFSPAALRALCAFKYKARIENGEPVAVENVKTRISFALN